MYAVSENPGEYHACQSSYSLFAFPFPEFISATLTLIFYKECFLLIKVDLGKGWSYTILVYFGEEGWMKVKHIHMRN